MRRLLNRSRIDFIPQDCEDRPMFEVPPIYRPALILAIALHLVLLIFLLVELPKHSVGTNALYNAPQVIQARAIEHDPAALMRQQQLAAERAAQKQQQLAQQKAAQEAAQQKAQAAAAAKALAQQKALEVAKKLALQKEVAEATAKPAAPQKPKPVVAQKPMPPTKTAEQKKLAALDAQQKILQQKLMAEQLQTEQQELAQSQQLAIQGEADKYMTQIKAAVQQNWQQPFQNASIFSVYEVKLAPGGVVLSVDLVQSSGNDVLDRSGKIAILKSSPLPVPQEAMLFDQFRDFKIKMTPQGAL